MPYYAPAGVPVAGNGISVSGSTVSINTNNALGIGAVAICYLTTGTLASGSTVAGASLTAKVSDVTLAIWSGAVAPSGTWRNISGITLTNGSGDVGTFIRTA